jgi:uncharacterized membrane protein YfcA
MLPSLVPVIAILFVATLVRSTFGFGESLVAVPLLAMVMPLSIAVPLSVLISILVAVIVVVQDRREIHVESARWLIGFALLGIPLGLAVLVYANPHWVKLVLGCIIVAYSAYALTNRRSLHLAHDHRGWLFVCGFASGVLGGAYGLNGPPLVIYGNLRRWSAQHFRATLQAYFLVTSLLGVAGYAVNGLLTGVVFRYFALSLPASLPAVFLGRHLNRKLQSASFFAYVYCGLLAIGALLVALTLTHVAR